MIDLVTIHVKAGHGGAGAVSFATYRNRPVAPPDGGDGGDGGSIYLLADPSVNTLLNFRYVKNFVVDNGENGFRNRQKGKTASDLFLKVPTGTIVKNTDGQTTADLTENGQKFLAAQGGKGGRGNTHFKPRKTSPSMDWELYRHTEPGQEGEERNLTLELKLLADIGLIGLPNAGKSTLLSTLTAATPKIAAYPFTTLEPNLGVWELPDRQSLVIADIPGLIEGAAQGKGLGDEFLRHIERTKLLVHLISTENDNIIKAYQTINKELAEYHQDLSTKPQIVVISKIDLVDEKKLKQIQNQFKKLTITPVAISALGRQGLNQLEKAVLKHLQ